MRKHWGFLLSVGACLQANLIKYVLLIYRNRLQAIPKKRGTLARTGFMRLTLISSILQPTFHCSLSFPPKQGTLTLIISI